MKKVVETARRIPCNVVGVAALCNRGGITAKDIAAVPILDSLIQVSLETWDEKDCPLCKKVIPINQELGKGREFLSKKK